MALPPNIPTSFVPRPQGASPARSSGSRYDFSGALVFVAALLFFLALAGALGVFLYGQYLAGAVKSRDAALTSAEAQVDQGTITSLVTLQEQLSEGKTLLDNHVALSQFFGALQTITPASIGYSSLSVSVNQDGTAAVSLSGTAASFNALAALSADLATNPDIKDAIFSGISVGKSGVGFTLAATLDSALVKMPASGFATAAPPIAPTQPATSTTP